MALVIPTGYGFARFGISLTGGNRLWYTTMGATLLSGESVVQYASAMDTLWLTHMAPASALINGHTLLPTTVYANVSGALETHTIGVSTVTTGAGTSVPPNSSVILRKRTPLAGRAFRGRMYLPSCFINETLVDNAGVIAGSAVTTLQNRANAWLAAATAQGRSLVLLHEASSPASIPTALTALTIDSVLGTQRKRMRG